MRGLLLLAFVMVGCDGGGSDTTAQVQDVDVPEFGRADVTCATPSDELRVPYNEDAIYQLHFCWDPDVQPGDLACEFTTPRLTDARDEIYATCAGGIGSLHLTWVAP